MPQEGQTAIGPNGERAVFQNGQWIIVPSAPQSPVTMGTPDLNKINKDVADINRTVTSTQIDRAKAPVDLAKTATETRTEQAKLDTGAGVIGADARKAALSQWQAAIALDQRIKELEQFNNQGPGATGFPDGIMDFLPLERNKRLDKASDRTRGLVKSALGLTGGEMNTGREVTMNIGGYLPDSWSYNQTNLDAIEALKQLRDNARSQAIATLGGVPDQNGRITPLANVVNGGVPPQGGGGGGTPGGGGMPPAGGDGGPQLGLSRGESYTTPQDLAVAAAVNQAFRAGGSVEDLAKAAQAAGGQITPADLAAFQQAIEARKNGQPVTFNPQSTGRRTGLQQFMGNALMNPAGTALATAVSGAGFNALDGLLPDQMQALRALNPNASTVGDVAGAIGGTQALAKIGEKAVQGGIGRVAPNLASRILGGGSKAQFARNVLADTAYGTAYGQNVNGDAATGAIGGALGSAGGQFAGKALAATVGGAMRSAPGQYLADRIGDLTVGQQLGGFAKSVEDALTSVPGIGDLINARRNESLTGLNRAAFREVGGVDQVGQPAMDALQTVTGNAYRDAVSGRNIPLDQQFGQDLAGTRAMRDTLAPDWQPKFDTAMRNRVDPFANNPSVSGDEYQQIMRGLKDYKGATAADGFEGDYRNAIGSAQDAFKGAALRSGDADMVSKLADADRMYRGQKIIEDAIGRNRKDAMGIGTDMFRPGDLTDAVYQNARKFKGTAPLEELARAAQTVIPSKLADSGTARRAMMGALATGGLGGLLGGGAGFVGSENGNVADAAVGGRDGAAAALAALALAGLGGTRAGQRQIGKVLFERPNALKAVGNAIRTGKRKGLFGAAAVPFLLESRDQ